MYVFRIPISTSFIQMASWSDSNMQSAARHCLRFSISEHIPAPQRCGMVRVRKGDEKKKYRRCLKKWRKSGQYTVSELIYLVKTSNYLLDIGTFITRPILVNGIAAASGRTVRVFSLCAAISLDYVLFKSLLKGRRRVDGRLYNGDTSLN